MIVHTSSGGGTRGERKTDERHLLLLVDSKTSEEGQCKESSVQLRRDCAGHANGEIELYIVLVDGRKRRWLGERESKRSLTDEPRTGKTSFERTLARTQKAHKMLHYQATES
jgi:hypothetical protein